jgi:hypothetical protein
VRGEVRGGVARIRRLDPTPSRRGVPALTARREVILRATRAMFTQMPFLNGDLDALEASARFCRSCRDGCSFKRRWFCSLSE